MVKHGTTEHFGIETFSDGSAISRARTWCGHCQKWITTDGVLAALQFMGQHRDGDCQKTKP